MLRRRTSQRVTDVHGAASGNDASGLWFGTFMRLSRRRFSKLGLAASAAALAPGWERAFAMDGREPDLKLRLEPLKLEIGKGVVVQTVAYNGQVPGPTLRM